MFFYGFQEITGNSKLHYHLHQDELCIEEHLNSFEDLLKHLVEGKPIQHFFGWAGFCGLKILVNHQVLIPRPETEELVNLIYQDLKERDTLKVLDLGTGSGCISLALKNQLPQAKIKGVDLSDPALEMARKSAKINSLNVDFEKLNILNESFGLDEDVWVSNPPYIPEREAKEMEEHVINHEPKMALFAPGDPLIFYRKIIDQASLHPKNLSVYFEVHYSLGHEVFKLMKNKGLEDVELLMDGFGKPRMLRGKKIL